jgi:hypothetical protein
MFNTYVLAGRVLYKTNYCKDFKVSLKIFKTEKISNLPWKARDIRVTYGKNLH